jgi:hypothetical protein
MAYVPIFFQLLRIDFLKPFMSTSEYLVINYLLCCAKSYNPFTKFRIFNDINLIDLSITTHDCPKQWNGRYESTEYH